MPVAEGATISADHPEVESQAAAVSTIDAVRGVMRVTAFRRLWYSTALSSLGDWLGLLATTALATNLAPGAKAQAYAISGVLVVKLMPALILGPLAGAFADRFDRRRTMIVSDAIRFVLFLTIPLAHLVVSTHMTLAWLLIASFLIECVSLFWMPAKDASVPNLVRRDQIEAANQLSLITTYGLTPVLGAGLFSLLSLITNVLARHLAFFQAQPVNLALYFNAGTFLFGSIIVIFIPEISGHRAERPVEDQPSLLFLLREGALFVRSSRLVGGLIIGLIGAFVAAGAVIGSGKLFVGNLHGGNAAYGVLFGAVFVGLGTGMGFGPKIAGELSRRRLFGIALIFAAICLVLTSVMPQIALATVFVIGIGFGAGVAYLSGMTLLGTEVDDEMRGRVFALLQSMIRVVLVLALSSVPATIALVGKPHINLGFVDGRVDGTRLVLMAGGLLCLIAGLLSYRKLDDREQVAMWPDVKAALRRDAGARRRMRDGGMFIAFEGGEGSGKSTQIERLAVALREGGRQVLITHEPGATEVGARIRDLVLHHSEPLSARSEALLFAADRAHHVDTVIRPTLMDGGIVLTDRYVDSSIAYQGVGRGLPVEEVRRMSRWATGGLRPDLTILLDVPAEIGLARATGNSTADKLEGESLEFHRRVRHAFRSLAESSPRHYRVIDARRTPDEIADEVREAVESLLPRRSRSRSVVHQDVEAGT